MYQKENFGSTAAQEKLASLKGQYVLEAGTKVNDANNTLEKVIFALNIHSAAPKFVLTRALYDKGDGETLESAHFVVRPAVVNELSIDELKHTFKITADSNFFDKFIEEMANYFDRYHYFAQLQENVDGLNEKVAEIIEENEIPFQITFSLGSGLLDASDEFAVVGLDADVIEGLGDLPLFDTTLQSRVEGYKERIAETLKECTRPIDIVKVKTNVTKDLGIYSRKSLNKLIRQFVNRNAKFVRTGIGYVENDEFFAVVEKVAVTEEELKELDTTNALVVDNEGLSKKEEKEGKTKVVVTYKISPFLKENGTATEVALQEVI